jgi:hypothetical protein
MNRQVRNEAIRVHKVTESACSIGLIVHAVVFVCRALRAHQYLCVMERLKCAIVLCHLFCCYDCIKRGVLVEQDSTRAWVQYLKVVHSKLVFL